MAKSPDMLKSALWYAKRGLYVHPLHNPIFDDAGNCTGCTCEAWKRTQPKYGPNYKCEQPGKCPRTNWTEKSTIDPTTIRKWWGKKWCDGDVETGRQVWNYPNIGIDAGKSGLLILDPDSYKENYAGASFQLDENTIKTLTGGGGNHLWYGQPEGKAYGNATGTLPEGIDVRGAGGYVVAPPSMHKSGKRYAFVEGHSPADLVPLPLPQFLIDILEAARTSPAEDVQFSRRLENAPDLTLWHLSDVTLELICSGHPAGADRSSIDQKVITALLVAGADNDAIRDVFANFPIGEKYNERGDKYLAHSIGKARAWLADHSFEQAQPSILPQLLALRAWIQSAEFTARLIDAGIVRPAEYVKTFIAIINYAITRRAPRVLMGSHRLGEMTGYSHMTAKRHLAMFGEGITVIHKDGTYTHRNGLKLVTVTDDPDGYGKWIDLTDLLRSVNLSVNHSTVERVNTSQQVTNDHLADEAFVPYPRHFAIKMRPDAEILPQGLSAAALFIGAVLVEHGEMTRAVICELTGLSKYTVGKMLRRMADMGLLVVWEGKPYRYDLHPDFEAVLDDLRPLLPSYELTRRRGYVKAKACSTFVSRRIHDTEPGSREEAKLLVRRDRYEKAMHEHIDCAAANGVDVTAPLMEPRETKEQAINRIHQAHLDRLRYAQRVGECAERRPKNYTETDEEMLSFARDISDKYKRMVYVYDRNSAEAEWADLNAWAVMEYGPGWWLHRDQADIVQDYRLFKKGAATMPTMHFDGVVS